MSGAGVESEQPGGKQVGRVPSENLAVVSYRKLQATRSGNWVAVLLLSRRSESPAQTLTSLGEKRGP